METLFISHKKFMSPAEEKRKQTRASPWRRAKIKNQRLNSHSANQGCVPECPGCASGRGLKLVCVCVGQSRARQSLLFSLCGVEEPHGVGGATISSVCLWNRTVSLMDRSQFVQACPPPHTHTHHNHRRQPSEEVQVTLSASVLSCTGDLLLARKMGICCKINKSLQFYFEGGDSLMSYFIL